jgi:hypothetical protein
MSLKISLVIQNIETEKNRLYGLLYKISKEIENLDTQKKAIENKYFDTACFEIINPEGCSSAEDSNNDVSIQERCAYYCNSDDELETIKKNISNREDSKSRIQHHIAVLNILSNEIDKKIKKREKLLEKTWYPQFLKKYLCSRKKISKKDIQDYANAEIQKFVLSL